jgi:long-chain acyl-CoA synthetase
VISAGWRATVGDIDDWSRLAADRVSAERLAPGSVVGLAAPNGPAFLAGFLALRRTRCTVLLLDEGAPPDDRARVLSAIGARAVLDCRMTSDARGLTARVNALAGPTEPPEFPDRAVIKMTSGSMGTPRGVAVTAESLLADDDALTRTMGLREDDRLVAALPMSHRYGFTSLALPALTRGLQLAMPADAGPLAPLAAADQCDATVFPTVPAYLQAVLRLAQPPRWPRSIRLCLTAGAPLPPATAAQFRERTGRRVHVFYGSSECGGICFDREGDAGERGTVGTPIDGVSISLVAVDDAPPGTGLVCVRSAAVGETYVPASDPRLGGGRFQTADLAMWRDGEIELLRRADRVINVRGFKVDPGEVERVLADLPGVLDAVVTGTPGPDGLDTMLRAFVACPPGTLDAATVTAWCRPRLSDHKVPRSIVIVDQLPRTPRGKIDRVALDHA